MRKPAFHFAAVATLAAAAYFLSARLGYVTAIKSGPVTLWPPAGLMLGLLIVSPRRDWPSLIAGALLGSFSSDLRSGFGIAFAAGAAVANLIESTFAACLFTRLDPRGQLDKIGSVFVFIVAALAANSTTALVGAVVMHVANGTPLWTAWIVWWIGDGLGMIIVAPIVIVWGGRHRVIRSLDRRAVIEAVAAIFSVVIASLIVFGDRETLVGQYTLIPVLLWASLRFGLHGATAAILIASAISLWFAAQGVGPVWLPTTTPLQAATQTYEFLTVAVLSALLPAAVVTENAVAIGLLGESEDRYRSVVDAANDAIVTIGESSEIQFANLAAERVFGFPASEMVGRNLSMLMPGWFRERHLTGFTRYLETGQRTQAWRDLSLTGQHRDGREIPLEVSFGETTSAGRRRFTGIFRDVTEKKAAEAALRSTEDRLRFTIETAGVGLWDVDLATRAARWSHTMERLHGLEPSSFAGTPEAFLACIHPEDRQTMRDVVRRAIEEGRESTVQYRTVWPDGSVHWISAISRTQRADDDRPPVLAGIALDITELRRLEEQYRQSQKMEAFGQLAGGVAHDFNNILTAIHGFATLLDFQTTDPRGQRDLAEIVRATERGASLTRQLLAFSRQQILTPKILDLRVEVQAVKAMLERLIGEDISIVVRAPDELRPVRADPGQIEQVMLNLAVNARDAMPEGGTIRFELEDVLVDETNATPLRLAPGDYVRLSVTDTGTGMDAATKARIFEPFFTTKAQGKGTGLGLATVFGIAAQSGGAVHVQSEPGRGSTFQVYLPAAEERPERPATEAAPIPRGSETILVAEDDAALRRIVCRLLEVQGYDVMSAADVEGAIALAGDLKRPVDLLLSDVVMPGMSGRVLAEHLQRGQPSLRVLYMSGYTDDAVLHRGVRRGLVHFIQKPFSHEELLTKVREVLDEPRPR